MASQNAVGPPSHSTRDSPFGMPYRWNTEAPVNEEQEQQNVVNNDEAGSHAQKDGSRTAQPFMIHRRMPQTKEKWQSLEEQLHAVEGGNRYMLEAVDLCLVLDIGLPVDFKTPKFDKYKGSSCLGFTWPCSAERWQLTSTMTKSSSIAFKIA
ncbi:hypothetical protein CR513_36169, partial [Mucuna pruriens]